MSIRELKTGEEEEWDEFVRNHPDSLISHLYYWNKIYKDANPDKKIKFLDLIAEENDEIIGIMPNLIRDRKIISEGGPCIKNKNIEYVRSKFIEYVEKYMKKENLISSQISSDPNTLLKEDMEWLSNYGYLKNIGHSVVLSLKPPLDEIWKNIPRKRRPKRNVGRARKKGVKIIKATKKEDMIEFHKLVVARDERKHRGSGYPLSFYYTLWDILKIHYNMCDIYFAEYEGKKISGAIITKYNKKAVYFGAASLKEFWHLSPNHLLTWQIISDLKEEGFEVYDLDGVGPDSPDPQVRGIAEFKMSWGGELCENIRWIKYRSSLLKIIDQLKLKIILSMRISKRIIYAKMNKLYSLMPR